MRRLARGPALAATLLALGTAAPAEEAQRRPAPIDRNGVIILVRSTLLALDHANKTGNYTVLRDLGAPAFQANSAAALGDIFAQQRRDRLDLSGVAVIEPQLTVLPEVNPAGFMHMAGLFPSVPTQINFDLVYAPVNGQWRLFGLSVSLGQSGPVAPSPPQKPPPAPAAQKPAADRKPAPASAKPAP